jgi:calcineurin B family protein 1
MGIGSSMDIEKKELEEIVRETGFRVKQIEYLHTRFVALDKKMNGYLKRQDFEAMPDIKVNPLRDRILEVLINDFGDSEKLTFKQFVTVFATFRRKVGNEEIVRNTRDNRTQFLFSIYDRDKDGKINRTELLSVLNILVGKSLPEEHILAIVERTVAELNLVDQDIDYQTFCETLKKIDIDEKMSIKIKS